jgi:hypothetical protein
MPRTLAATALLYLLFAPLAANGLNWEQIDADGLVDHCREVSREKLESGVTVQMREGMANTIDCLAEEIVRHADAFLLPRTMSDAEVRQALSEIGASHGKLYWLMYNEHKGCQPGCGTMYHVFHVGALAALFQNILRDLVTQRNEYRE